MGNYTIFKGQNGQFYFNLKAGNGEIILSSEGYITKISCQHGIDSVRLNSQNDNCYQRRNDSTYTFTLHALNGQIIGRSESYSSSIMRDHGISSVKANAPSAPITDLT
jgi:uncharacterized protein YegP (UPF0339 family)